MTISEAIAVVRRREAWMHGDRTETVQMVSPHEVAKAAKVLADYAESHAGQFGGPGK